MKINLLTDTQNFHYIVCVLMSIAAFLHLIQLFLFPVNFKWMVSLIGTVAYSIASFGLYQNKKFGYYITIIFPIAGVLFVGIFVLLGFAEVIGYGEINPYTLLAAVVEIPAIILSLIALKKGRNNN